MQSIDQILDPKYQPWGNTGPRKAYYQVCMNVFKKKNQFTDATYIHSLTHTRPDMCHECTNVMFHTSALVYFVLWDAALVYLHTYNTLRKEGRALCIFHLLGSQRVIRSKCVASLCVALE
jgi:hypothetical protein